MSKSFDITFRGERTNDVIVVMVESKQDDNGVYHEEVDYSIVELLGADKVKRNNIDSIAVDMELGGIVSIVNSHEGKKVYGTFIPPHGYIRLKVPYQPELEDSAKQKAKQEEPAVDG